MIGQNIALKRLIRYVNFTSISIALIGLVLIWSGQFKDLGLILSSVFAVIGIGFFCTMVDSKQYHKRNYYVLYVSLISLEII